MLGELQMVISSPHSWRASCYDDRARYKRLQDSMMRRDADKPAIVTGILAQLLNLINDFVGFKRISVYNNTVM